MFTSLFGANMLYIVKRMIYVYGLVRICFSQGQWKFNKNHGIQDLNCVKNMKYLLNEGKIIIFFAHSAKLKMNMANNGIFFMKCTTRVYIFLVHFQGHRGLVNSIYFWNIGWCELIQLFSSMSHVKSNKKSIDKIWMDWGMSHCIIIKVSRLFDESKIANNNVWHFTILTCNLTSNWINIIILFPFLISHSLQIWSISSHIVMFGKLLV